MNYVISLLLLIQNNNEIVISTSIKTLLRIHTFDPQWTRMFTACRRDNIFGEFLCVRCIYQKLSALECRKQKLITSHSFLNVPI